MAIEEAEDKVEETVIPQDTEDIITSGTIAGHMGHVHTVVANVRIQHKDINPMLHLITRKMATIIIATEGVGVRIGKING